MSFVKEATTAIRFTLILWLLTAVIYPFFTLFIGQVIFPYQANGSLVFSQNKYIGSALIGQNFTSAQYFWSRPSTINHSSFTSGKGDPKDLTQTTGRSGASNLAPSNPDLVKRITAEVERLKRSNTTPTTDLVYTSGSGLDPHITPEAAKAQVERIAKARSLTADKIQAEIDQHTHKRLLGILGEDKVNVLELNMALDQLKS